MECLQNRQESFFVPRLKRTKASSSKATSSKWPHPSSFKATPDTLAEAGFYLTSSPDYVKCFMCNKEIGGWEQEDDPFEVHYDKCRDVCPWAVVRCLSGIGEENHDLYTARHPTSKTMEKARLDTFSKYQWPHDAVDGHGANSKALAKAGFICNPFEPGDDNAVCLYCNVSLTGWDQDDDPYEEHLRRSQKNKKPCAFLKAFAVGNNLNKSIKRPASKAATKPPARTASRMLRNAPAKEEADGPADVVEAELAAEMLSSLTSLPETSRGRASRASPVRPSAAATKTPGSRRSTRGTGKTPGSRPISSEVEETDAGSESDTGKRSKSKRKTGGRAMKARVSAIVEEEDDVDARVHEPEDVDQDVEMQIQEIEQEPPKKTRGRQPRSAIAKSMNKAQSPEAKSREDDVVIEAESEPAPPPAKKGHGRTRSKANIEAEAAASSSSKGTHKRTKSARTKAKPEDEEETHVAIPAPLANKGKGKVALSQDEDVVVHPPPAAKPKSKPKGRTVSRSKAKVEPQIFDTEDERASQLSRGRTQTERGAIARESQASDERKSSLSEDAGYATAEPPPEVDRMNVDGSLPSQPQPQASPASNPVQSPSRATSGTSANSDASKRPIPVLNGTRASSAAPSSRPSSSRPPAKVNKESLKVIEIDSDGEETSEYGITSKAPLAKEKALLARVESRTFVKKPSSETSKRKLLVEVVVPPVARPSPRSPAEDVHMEDALPTSHLSSHPVHKDDVALSKPPAPGTPVSAVHRSAPVSPAHEGGDDGDIRMSDSNADAATVASNSPRTYHPFLAQLPIEKLASLTEEEAEMTLEQFIRREMELQYTQLRTDAERRIEEFQQMALETRRAMEAA